MSLGPGDDYLHSGYGCFDTGEPGASPEDAEQRWPTFADKMREAGYACAYSVPMRWQATGVGGSARRGGIAPLVLVVDGDGDVSDQACMPPFVSSQIIGDGVAVGAGRRLCGLFHGDSPPSRASIPPWHEPGRASTGGRACWPPYARASWRCNLVWTLDLTLDAGEAVEVSLVGVGEGVEVVLGASDRPRGRPRGDPRPGRPGEREIGTGDPCCRSARHRVSRRRDEGASHRCRRTLPLRPAADAR